MEILTTAEVEGKTLSIEKNIINENGDKFLTIKELFSIEGEIFVAILNHQIPYTLPGTQIQTCRFIMPAKKLIAMHGDKL
jgi:hypothetical protein